VFDIGNLTDLRLAVGEAPPNATTSGEIGLNLPANAEPPVSPVFDPLDTDSFNNFRRRRRSTTRSVHRTSRPSTSSRTPAVRQLDGELRDRWPRR
jgi:hypothetical protein